MRQLYLSAIEASIILSVTPEHVYRECAAGKLPGAKKIDGKWRIPRTAHERFLAFQKKSDLESLHDMQSSFPVPKQKEAIRRLGMIRECEKFVAAHLQNGGKRTKALAIYAQQNSINLATLYRRINAYENYGIFGLVDTRGGNQYESPISPEAWEHFKAFYLTQEQLSIKLCWLMTDYLNVTEKHGWRVPGLPAMRNVVKREISLPVQVLHREGLTAYTAKCEPYIEVDYETVQPGQVWIGDHSQLNCWIRHRGAWVRPWITAFPIDHWRRYEGGKAQALGVVLVDMLKPDDREELIGMLAVGASAEQIKARAIQIVTENQTAEPALS
jgi:muconolactone delta-isomerase